MILYEKGCFCIFPLITVVLNGCKSSSDPFYDDPVLATLPAYTHQQFYSCGGFRDYTDYGKITFDEIEETDFLSSEYFHYISTEDMDLLELYMDDYEQWIQVHRTDKSAAELTENYNFDRSSINTGDYICIKGSDGQYNEDISVYGMFFYYSIYFFDAESSILYYFHSNM